MEHPAFRSGDFDTRFVENYFKPAALQAEASGQEEMLAAVLAATLFNGNGKGNAATEPATAASKPSKWRKNRV
jgi:propionyl-CoA carboxylase alpha chain